MSAHVSIQQEAEPAAEEPAAADEGRPKGSLPGIVTMAGRSEILDRLATASRRGRLPGFQPGNGEGVLFEVAAHGHPFDGVVVAELYRADQDGPGRMAFRVRMLPRTPVVFAAILAFTIWPGVYFMDELLAQLAPGLWSYAVNHWGLWATWYWYLPLTVLPIPWLWASLMRRSRVSIRAAAVEAIGKISREVEGTVVSEP